MEPRLVMVEHDQRGGTEASDLSAQLGSDRAPGPGDQHAPTSEVAGDLVDLGLNRSPPEQIHL